MTDLNRLAGLTATELTLLFVTPQTAPADMGHGDWLAVVQLLTARLTEEAKSLSATELNRGVEVRSSSSSITTKARPATDTPVGCRNPGSARVP